MVVEAFSAGVATGKKTSGGSNGGVNDGLAASARAEGFGLLVLRLATLIFGKHRSMANRLAQRQARIRNEPEFEFGLEQEGQTGFMGA